MSLFWDDATKEQLGWADAWALFQPVSKAGARFKKSVRPYAVTEREAWQEAMRDVDVLRAALEDDAWKKKAHDALKELPDVQALLALIEQGASLRPVDFFEVKAFLWKAWTLGWLLVEKQLSFSWWERIDCVSFLRKLNGPGELVPAFSVGDLFDDGMRALREEVAVLDAKIFGCKKEQTGRLRARYGRGPTRDGQYVWEKGEAAVLKLAEADEELALLSVNMFEAVYQVAEPPLASELRALREAKLVEIEDRETEVLRELVEVLRPDVPVLERALEAVARLDWTLAKSKMAAVWQSGESVWLEDGQAPWQASGGWQPVAREAVEKRGGTYTFLDMALQPGVGLITGPNMGGKTVVLKTLGLLQGLAQHGMPVPASRFQFHPVDRIGMSGGDEQSLTSGLSSFGAETMRLAALLREKGRALLLLDEVARTTNPEEGEALAVGLATHLLGTDHAALFASHFPGVTRVAGIQGFRVAGLRREVLDELEREQGKHDVLRDLQSAMDYRLIPCEGQEVPHDAVRLAACFGLPDGVLSVAREVLHRREGLQES